MAAAMFSNATLASSRLKDCLTLSTMSAPHYFFRPGLQKGVTEREFLASKSLAFAV